MTQVNRYGAGRDQGAMGWDPMGSQWGTLSHLLCPHHSDPGTAPPDAVPPAALFGPPLESAFEAEDFPGEDLGGRG